MRFNSLGARPMIFSTRSYSSGVSPCSATTCEVIAGSTRMNAGTAQKIVLNLFSTAVMVKMGRVYRGLMVDMRARNAKLRQRVIASLLAFDRGKAHLEILAVDCPAEVQRRFGLRLDAGYFFAQPLHQNHRRLVAAGGERLYRGQPIAA